jgi:hypothetical protein
MLLFGISLVAVDHSQAAKWQWLVMWTNQGLPCVFERSESVLPCGKGWGGRPVKC